MARIKVALITEAMSGGIREHVRQILEHIDHERFDMSLICSTLRDRRCEAELDRLCAAGIVVVRVPMRRSIRPWKDYRCYRRILWELRVRRFDVVHTHGSKGGFLGRLAASRAPGARVIHTGHTFPIQWARGPKFTFYAGLERYASQRTDLVLALSEAQRKLLLAARICPPEKISVVSNAPDVPLLPCLDRRRNARRMLGLKPDEPAVGMVGRIVRQKAPLLFVRAARLIAEARPDVRTVWIGDGPLRNAMERAAAREGILGTNLLIAGELDGTRTLYSAFDVFLMTTRWEGMSYAVLEAMASGVPVVAVNVPGMDEIVQDGCTGRLVPPDATALAAATLELLADANRRAAFGAEARSRIQRRHSLQRFIRTLEKLYANEL